MRLLRRKVAGGYRLNDQILDHKRALRGDLVVYAKTVPDGGSKGITAFRSKGLQGFFHRAEDRQGRHAWTPTAELVFDDCFVPDENVMGPLNGGVKVLMSGLDYERVVLSGFSSASCRPGRCRPSLCERAQAVRNADRQLPAGSRRRWRTWSWKNWLAPTSTQWRGLRRRQDDAGMMRQVPFSMRRKAPSGWLSRRSRALGRRRMIPRTGR